MYLFKNIRPINQNKFLAKVSNTSTLEFQVPTGPHILAPAVDWLFTLTFGLTSFTFALASHNLIKLRGDVNTNEQTKISWGCPYKRTI